MDPIRELLDRTTSNYENQSKVERVIEPTIPDVHAGIAKFRI